MDVLDTCSRSPSKQFEQSSSPVLSHLDEIEAKKLTGINNINNNNTLRSFNASNNSSKLNSMIENLNSSLKSTAQNKDESDENSNSSTSSSSSSSSSSRSSSSSSSSSSEKTNGSQLHEESLNSEYNETTKHDLTNNSTLSAAETLLEIKNFFSKNKGDESKQSIHFDDEDEKESSLKGAITPKSQDSSIDEEEKVLKELQNDFSENGQLNKFI